MGIKLDEERQQQIAQALVGFMQEQFDEQLSLFRAEEITSFMLQQIGPSQYNQAIQDARKFFADKVDQLDTEFFEPEEH